MTTQLIVNVTDDDVLQAALNWFKEHNSCCQVQEQYPMPDDVWDEDEDYPREDWWHACYDAETNLGYWAWVNHQRESNKKKYPLSFSDAQQEEILEGFCDMLDANFDPEKPATRSQWVKLSLLCVGKAEQIRRGLYDPEDELGSNARWIADLESIAAVINDFFKAGDGKL